MRAQAQLAEPFDRRFKAAFEAGVDAGSKASAAVEALRDPVVTRISSEAHAADHEHDAAVAGQLFPPPPGPATARPRCARSPPPTTRST